METRRSLPGDCSRRDKSRNHPSEGYSLHGDCGGRDKSGYRKKLTEKGTHIMETRARDRVQTWKKSDQGAHTSWRL